MAFWPQSWIANKKFWLFFPSSFIFVGFYVDRSFPGILLGWSYLIQLNGTYIFTYKFWKGNL